MIKYFFGYKNLFGQPFPIRWVEDEGVPVGGDINPIHGNSHEITHKEFTYYDLNTLKSNYPYKEPKSD